MNPATRPEVEQMTRARSTRSPRILLAEDDSELRSLIAYALQEAGFAVTECADGMQLADCLGECLLPGQSGQVEFDLIVSDIRMPWMTGLEALEVVGSSRAFPPMVLITAFGDDSTHEEARRLGAATILDKPFDPEELIRVARELLDGDRGGQESHECSSS